jgi:hypothetical protein
MSNIDLKGDVIQNLGEYLPNPYIESIEVSGETRTIIRVNYSLMFLISDEYNIEDIRANLNDINIYFVFVNGEQKTAITKSQLINLITGDADDSLSIVENNLYLGNTTILTNYEDNLYDQSGRRILKIYLTEENTFDVPANDPLDRTRQLGQPLFGEKSANIPDRTGALRQPLVEKEPSNIPDRTSALEQPLVEQATAEAAPMDSDVYVYAFSSVVGNEIRSSSKNVAYLNTGNIAYEKIFSPGKVISRQEEPAYFDIEKSKYGQTPILGLDKEYYKAETVTRDEIISKVNNLIKRFDNSSNESLKATIDSIKYVLNTEAATENLLVELDKVRRSFPNKTNNNPVGNLYAAYSKLLQNINSAFAPIEMLSKNRYITGKVLDLRTSFVQEYRSPPEPASIEYVPENMFLAHSERYDNTTGINKGIFFIRYEEMLKRESTIFKVISQEKFYNIASGSDLNNLRRILFSYFNVRAIGLIKGHNNETIQESVIRYVEGRRDTSIIKRSDLYKESFGEIESSIEEHNFGFQEPRERLLNYTFTDIDAIDSDELIFDYTVKITLNDRTKDFIESLINKYDETKKSMDDYLDFANEICSYNNIDNRFNNFFTRSIRDRYPDGAYPWKIAPTYYSLMTYLLTDQFGTFEEATEYSRNISSTISPEGGNLTSLTDFANMMDSLRAGQINDLQNNLASFGDGLVEIKKEKIIETVINEVSYQESLYGEIKIFQCLGNLFEDAGGDEELAADLLEIRKQEIRDACKAAGVGLGSKECFEIREELYPVKDDDDCAKEFGLE